MLGTILDHGLALRWAGDHNGGETGVHRLGLAPSNLRACPPSVPFPPPVPTQGLSAAHICLFPQGSLTVTALSNCSPAVSQHTVHSTYTAHSMSPLPPAISALCCALLCCRSAAHLPSASSPLFPFFPFLLPSGTNFLFFLLWSLLVGNLHGLPTSTRPGSGTVTTVSPATTIMQPFSSYEISPFTATTAQ